MNQIIKHGNDKPRISMDAKANLDVKLEGWQATTAVGLVVAGAVVIVDRISRSKSRS